MKTKRKRKSAFTLTPGPNCTAAVMPKIEYKPNPTDSTTRKVRASRKRDDKLLERIRLLEARIKHIEGHLKAVFAGGRHLKNIKFEVAK